MYITKIVIQRFTGLPTPLTMSAFIPTAIGTFCSILVGDFIFYWYHRAQHSFPFLWSIHELHHADTELNATTSLRTYFLENILQTIIIAFPLIYIFGNSRDVVVLTVILTTLLFFTHANLRLSMGIFTKVLTGPQLHRIHHSIEKQHQDKNFAQFFPLFDILFGTYYHPHKDEFPKTGAPHLRSDAPITETLLRPWNQLLGKLMGDRVE
jgi:sterol desaturase/sphingolipid hydroxylase (fatty acid hydroxylase superfamily)